MTDGFGQWLREAIREANGGRGIKVAALAELSGVHRTLIYRALKGGRTEQENVEKLAHGLGRKPPSIQVVDGGEPLAATPLRLVRQARDAIERAEGLLATSNESDG